MPSLAADNLNRRPKRKRRWFQFGLPTLLVLVTLSAVFLALIVNPAQRQRRAVAAIQSLGGEVFYEDSYPFTKPPASRSWLRDKLGEDYFVDVGLVFLRGAEVGDADLRHLAGLPALQNVLLHNTQVSDAGLAHLKGLTGLKYLSLVNTPVTDEGLVHLKPLTPLEGLNLNGTHITDAGLEHLQGLTRLQDLSLKNTQVTDAGLEHLQNLPQLKGVYLGNTQVTDAGIAALRAALPDCTIEHN